MANVPPAKRRAVLDYEDAELAGGHEARAEGSEDELVYEDEEEYGPDQATVDSGPWPVAQHVIRKCTQYFTLCCNRIGCPCSTERCNHTIAMSGGDLHKISNAGKHRRKERCI
jgi:hypothetical protein